MKPTTDRFIAVVHGEELKTIKGNALTGVSDLPFGGLSVFGSGFLNKFAAAVVPAPLLKGEGEFPHMTHLLFVGPPFLLFYGIFSSFTVCASPNFFITVSFILSPIIYLTMVFELFDDSILAYNNNIIKKFGLKTDERDLVNNSTFSNFTLYFLRVEHYRHSWSAIW